MDITGLDFILVNVLSYFAGVFTGLTERMSSPQATKMGR